MQNIQAELTSAEAGDPAADTQIPQLVGMVYESAPAAERSGLLEHLLNPLGLLALASVANGIFAKIQLRSGWRDFHVPLEELQKVRTDHVIDLANRVQQVSIESIDALGEMLKTWPVMSHSVAAALLATSLLHHAKTRRRALVKLPEQDLNPPA